VQEQHWNNYRGASVTIVQLCMRLFSNCFFAKFSLTLWIFSNSVEGVYSVSALNSMLGLVWRQDRIRQPGPMGLVQQILRSHPTNHSTIPYGCGHHSCSSPSPPPHHLLITISP
jgi:hypothetical protein